MWTNFNNPFTVVFVEKLQKKIALDLPPHLKSIAALPCENWMFNCAALQHIIIYCRRDAESFIYCICLPEMLDSVSYVYAD